MTYKAFSFLKTQFLPTQTWTNYYESTYKKTKNLGMAEIHKSISQFSAHPIVQWECTAYNEDCLWKWLYFRRYIEKSSPARFVHFPTFVLMGLYFTKYLHKWLQQFQKFEKLSKIQLPIWLQIFYLNIQISQFTYEPLS